MIICGLLLKSFAFRRIIETMKVLTQKKTQSFEAEGVTKASGKCFWWNCFVEMGMVSNVSIDCFSLTQKQKFSLQKPTIKIKYIVLSIEIKETMNFFPFTKFRKRWISFSVHAQSTWLLSSHINYDNRRLLMVWMVVHCVFFLFRATHKKSFICVVILIHYVGVCECEETEVSMNIQSDTV